MITWVNANLQRKWLTIHLVLYSVIYFVLLFEKYNSLKCCIHRLIFHRGNQSIHAIFDQIKYFLGDSKAIPLLQQILNSRQQTTLLVLYTPNIAQFSNLAIWGGNFLLHFCKNRQCFKHQCWYNVVRNCVCLKLLGLIGTTTRFFQNCQF